MLFYGIGSHFWVRKWDGQSDFYIIDRRGSNSLEIVILKVYNVKKSAKDIDIFTKKGGLMSKNHQTGMRGVYLVSAELAKLGFIASPTSRSSFGADILVTDSKCNKAYSVQVKTNAATFAYWLLNKDSKDLKSNTHIYVFVNLRDKKHIVEYFVVPSRIVSEKMAVEKHGKDIWYSFSYEDAKEYQDKWAVFSV